MSPIPPVSFHLQMSLTGVIQRQTKLYYVACQVLLRYELFAATHAKASESNPMLATAFKRAYALRSIVKSSLSDYCHADVHAVMEAQSPESVFLAESKQKKVAKIFKSLAKIDRIAQVAILIPASLCGVKVPKEAFVRSTGSVDMQQSQDVILKKVLDNFLVRIKRQVFDLEINAKIEGVESEEFNEALEKNKASVLSLEQAVDSANKADENEKAHPSSESNKQKTEAVMGLFKAFNDAHQEHLKTASLFAKSIPD